MTASKIGSIYDTVRALEAYIDEQLSGRTPEYDRLAQRQNELVHALNERLDDDGRRTLDELNDLFGPIANEAQNRGFRFGFRLGRSDLVEAALNGDSS